MFYVTFQKTLCFQQLQTAAPSGGPNMPHPVLPTGNYGPKPFDTCSQPTTLPNSWNHLANGMPHMPATLNGTGAFDLQYSTCTITIRIHGLYFCHPISDAPTFNITNPPLMRTQHEYHSHLPHQKSQQMV